MGIKAVLFDADNTLYDTKGLAGACDREALAKLAPAKSREAVEEFYAIVADTKKSCEPAKRTRAYSYSLVAKQLGAPAESAEKAAEHFQKIFLEKLKPKPGALQMLSILKGRGIRLAVVTAEERGWAHKKLERVGIGGFFDAVITSDDVGRMKPDQKYFSFACEKLSLKPQDCLVIGDDEDGDLKPARALGMAAEKPAPNLISLLLS